MLESEPVCIHCQVSEEAVPLVTLLYQGKPLYICAQHLPLLIHDPAKLIGSLPGAEQLKAYRQDG